jgi:type VI secretion system protein ImpA
MTPLTLSLSADDLLAPVPGSAPAGIDARTLSIFEEIKTTRREARADPGELGPARRVIELLTQAFTRSKDLQLGVWLLEFTTRVDGYSGAALGLVVLRRLMVEYWESLFPLLDTDESDPLERRRVLLEWIDQELPGTLKAAPLTAPPASFGLLHYEVTQKTGDEKRALIESGWPTGERFEEALHQSTLKHLEGVIGEIITCEAELAALQAVTDQRFNAASAPGDRVVFTTLQETLAGARWLVERPLKQKRKDQPAGQADAAVQLSPEASTAGSRNGDEIWNQALDFTRGSRVDGLRLLQSHVAEAPSGRERFLRQLQLAELALEAGIYTLAFPVFDELARTIDTRQLEQWEDRALVARVLSGLIRCCGLLKPQIPTADARAQEAQAKLAALDPAGSSSSVS